VLGEIQSRLHHGENPVFDFLFKIRFFKFSKSRSKIVDVDNDVVEILGEIVCIPIYKK
jgi:hypothetical protein